MKNFSHNININQHSNTVISHSESDWAVMRKNSLIFIDKDTTSYIIGNTEKLNFIVDFILQHNNIIEITGNFEHYFLRDDIITVSYKEYELLVIKNIIAAGSGYKVGDTVLCSGGNVSINTFDNTKYNTILQVEEVDPNGAIIKLKIINKGRYLSAPESNNKIIGGHGRDAEIEIEYVLSSHRAMIERQVLNAFNQNHNTILELNDNLPTNVRSGKISIEKYIGYLTTNYVGETKRNADYHIVRDQTPFLQLPLLSKNSPKTEEFYNHTILELDRKLRELDERLKKANL